MTFGRPFALIAGIGLCALSGPAAVAGTITGIVSARGPAGAQTQDSDGAYQSRRYRLVEKIDYDHLQDFVVSIDQVVPGAASDPPVAATITQRDVNFDPRVLPIVVGTTVKWPNADDIFHNVFSISETRDFDLGMYTKNQKVPEVRFDKQGRVDVFCAIHSRMHCIILVLPSPFFAKVKANERYTIRGVPAGTYHLRAWHERLPPQTREVTVTETGETSADFTLGFDGQPKL